MKYSCTILHPLVQETFIHSIPPPRSLYFKAQQSIQVAFLPVHPSFLVSLSGRYLLKIRSWCVHVSGYDVHCNGPRCSLRVPVGTHIVTSWRLALMDQTSLSCVLLLQFPPCPLWTQISCSVITASLLSPAQSCLPCCSQPLVWTQGRSVQWARPPVGKNITYWRNIKHSLACHHLTLEL